MSWFLNSKPDSVLAEAALLSAGKALHIANDFEQTAKHILRTLDMSNYLKDNQNATITETFNATYTRLFLDGTIKRLSKFSDITAKHLSILERAKNARNFIAHEGALFFAFSNDSLILARLKVLRREVEYLTHGANLVSLWSYEIENKEPGPKWYFDRYQSEVDDWVFGHLVELLDACGDESEILNAEAMLQAFKP